MTSWLKGIVATIEVENQPEIWHYRCGHMSEKGTMLLISKLQLPRILKSVEFS